MLRFFCTLFKPFMFRINLIYRISYMLHKLLFIFFLQLETCYLIEARITIDTQKDDPTFLIHESSNSSRKLLLLLNEFRILLSFGKRSKLEIFLFDIFEQLIQEENRFTTIIIFLFSRIIKLIFQPVYCNFLIDVISSFILGLVLHHNFKSLVDNIVWFLLLNNNFRYSIQYHFKLFNPYLFLFLLLQISLACLLFNFIRSNLFLIFKCFSFHVLI